MRTKEIVQKCSVSGLFTSEDDPYFTWSGCDCCEDGLGAEVYDCKGYISLEDARGGEDNLYEFKLCGECLIKLYYGES